MKERLQQHTLNRQHTEKCVESHTSKLYADTNHSYRAHNSYGLIARLRPEYVYNSLCLGHIKT